MAKKAGSPLEGNLYFFFIIHKDTKVCCQVWLCTSELLPAAASAPKLWILSLCKHRGGDTAAVTRRCSANEKIQFRNPGYIQHLSSLSPSDVMCAGRCQLIPNFSQYLSLHRRTFPSKCQNKPTNSQFRVVEIICEDLKTQYIFSPSPTLPGLAEVL